MSEVVKVSQLVERLSLEVVTDDKKSLDRVTVTGNISCLEPELAGYFNYYSHNRLQLFGNKEISFAERMTPEERLVTMRRLCSEDIPVSIILRGLPAPEEVIQAANENGIAVPRSPISTSRLLGELSSYLDGHLTPRTSVHGVLVDVYGLGVLIQGDSGVGGSKTALELIKHGHRLIADDRVDVYQQDELTAIGEPPKILEHLIEIQGIGIVDVMNLFGASAIRGSMQIQLAIYLEAWAKDKKYDRLDFEDTIVEIAEVGIPQIKVPVKTERNVAIITEVAAMSFRTRTTGFNAAETFEERLSHLTGENSSND